METESKTLTISQVAVTVAGLSGNAYIIALCFKVWSTTGHLSPKEKLDFSLSSVNLCLQILLLSYNLCYFYWIGVSNVEILSKLFLLSGLILISSSLWISTWLSVYCNIKILNSQHRIHQLMKRHMSKMVTWLIVGSLILATAQSLPAISDLYIIFVNTSTNEDNLAKVTVDFSTKCSACSMWLYFVISFLAFFLFFIANVTILRSLYRHVRRMGKISIISGGNPQLDKLFRAAKTVTLLLLTCIIFFVSLSVLLTKAVNYGTPLFLICVLLVSSFPAFNATVLIMGSQKLKQPLLDIVKWFNRT